jgi:hypothetical protein
VSYILDALKKAERDRRDARVPSLGTLHAIPEEPRNVWPWVVGGVVALNVAALGVFLVLREAPAPPPPATVVAPRPVTPPAAPPAPAATPAPAKPAEPTATAPAPAAKPASRAAATREASPRRDPDALKLDVLVYSTNPAERAAYINGTRYLEGQRVNARFVVERITADSVVLAGKDARHVLKQQ